MHIVNLKGSSVEKSQAALVNPWLAAYPNSKIKYSTHLAIRASKQGSNIYELNICCTLRDMASLQNKKVLYVRRSSSVGKVLNGA